MVADAIDILVGRDELVAADLLRHLDGLDHRGVAEAAAADVVGLRDPWRLKELVKCMDEVATMNRIADLLSLVAVDRVRGSRHGTAHYVCEKSMQLRSGMVRTGQSAAPKTRRVEPKVATVLLNQDVGSDLRGAEDAVERTVDRHVLPDTVPIRVLRVDLP